MIFVDSLSQPSINDKNESMSKVGAPVVVTTQASTTLPVTTACRICSGGIANAILLLPKDVKLEKAAILVNSIPAENATVIIRSTVVVGNVPTADIDAKDFSKR